MEIGLLHAAHTLIIWNGSLWVARLVPSSVSLYRLHGVTCLSIHRPSIPQVCSVSWPSHDTRDYKCSIAVCVRRQTTWRQSVSLRCVSRIMKISASDTDRASCYPEVPSSSTGSLRSVKENARLTNRTRTVEMNCSAEERER
jgi:hypothetical protein